MWRAAPAALPCLLAATEMQHYLWPIIHSVSIIHHKVVAGCYRQALQVVADG